MPNPDLRKKLRAVLTCRISFLLLVWICQFQGCLSVPDSQPTYHKTARYEADLKLLLRGNKAYRSGDYQKAVKIFGSLRHAQDADISGRALYGLACSRLITAETVDEWDAAMALWNSWQQLPPHASLLEDPRLLAPLIKSSTHHDIQQAKRPGNIKNAQEIIRTKEKEIRSLKNKLDRMEKESRTKEDTQRQKTASLEEEIKLLKHQIKSLEAIDQKIREKKRGIAAP